MTWHFPVVKIQSLLGFRRRNIVALHLCYGRSMITPRQRDRRQALTDLFTALSRALDRQSDVSLMRGAFEQMVRRLVPVRTIQLREAGSRWSGRIESGAGSESIALDVPGPDPATKGVLEASFDPACCLGEWDFQMLGLAAHIGALVLEIERGRLQLARAGLSGSSGPSASSVRRARDPGATGRCHSLDRRRSCRRSDRASIASRLPISRS